ncbi:hypothetical protein AG1IA_01625 [Rhizoctonia solani AG-1 IA]|uniref:Uncharacterized protein n=1 Tax=Thanatephorus cucumeris (strain AG1-IA) TaxID=983506 RepID=L8X225_THACA|nr:hypothetical protein AG1IA_01625 [Rhizoctonia solani AG-1 IA]
MRTHVKLPMRDNLQTRSQECTRLRVALNKPQLRPVGHRTDLANHSKPLPDRALGHPGPVPFLP